MKLETKLVLATITLVFCLVGCHMAQEADAESDQSDFVEVVPFGEVATLGDETPSYKTTGSITNGTYTSTFYDSSMMMNIYISANSGYAVPKDSSAITIKDASNNSVVFSYKANSDRKTALIVVSDVQSDLKISGSCSKTISVTINSVTTSTTTTQGVAYPGEAFTTTFSAKVGYDLPSSSGIVVKIGTKTSSSYTYNATTGVLTINASAITSSTSSITITGTYTAKTYTLTGNITHGSLGQPSATIKYGSTFTVKIVPDKGYSIPASVTVLNGTSKNSFTYDSNTGTVEVKGVQGNIVITADCGAASYKITYYVDGEVCALQPSSYVYGQGAVLPTELNVEGKIFKCWVDANGSEITKISTTSIGDISVYADLDYDSKDIETLMYLLIVVSVVLAIFVAVISRK